MDALSDRAMPTRRDSRDLGGAADAEVAPDVHRDFYGELFYSTI
jgi:hypothetical protein